MSLAYGFDLFLQSLFKCPVIRIETENCECYKDCSYIACRCKENKRTYCCYVSLNTLKEDKGNLNIKVFELECIPDPRCQKFLDLRSDYIKRIFSSLVIIL